jgi:hypothetical protein
MRALAFLLKLPSEDFKHFNDRLAQACQVLQPTDAALACIDGQPKVTLLHAVAGTAAAAEHDATTSGMPVRVAVCPQDATDDVQAAQTAARLGRILDAAQGRAVAAIDAADGRLCLLLWPLVGGGGSAAGSHSPQAGPQVGSSATTSGPQHPTTDPSPPPPRGKRASGRPLFGVRGGPNGQEEHPEEGPIVRTVLECLDAGLRHDQIDRQLMEDHGDWVREHWNPRDRPKLLARIVERADWYRTALLGAAPAGAPVQSGARTPAGAR